jgi:hypothetical protein
MEVAYWVVVIALLGLAAESLATRARVQPVLCAARVRRAGTGAARDRFHSASHPVLPSRGYAGADVRGRKGRAGRRARVR